MSGLDFVSSEASQTHIPISEVVEPLLGIPDFSDIEAEYEDAGRVEPEPQDWSKHRANESETVPEDILKTLEAGVFMGVSFLADLACGFANRKPFEPPQKMQTTERVMNVLKFYPSVFKKTGTAKGRAWAALGADITMKGFTKKAEPPAVIYPDVNEAMPPESDPASAGAFNTGGQSFGANKP